MPHSAQNPPPAPPVVGQGQVIAPPALPQVGNVAEVREQLRDLAERLKGANRLRTDLVHRIEGANGSELTELQQRLAVTDAQIASLQGQFSQVVGQLAQQQVQHWLPGVMVDPPSGSGPTISPDVFRAGLIILVLGVIIPLSLGFARLLRRRRPQPVPPAPRDGEVLTTERLDRLEQAVDSIAIEIERISESQRFIVRILNERATSSRTATEAKDVALKDATPFLALGAGPIEPIRVGERQAVKPSITPH